MFAFGHREEWITDPRVVRIAHSDTRRWYEKPNLRTLYFILIPCALGVEMTSGFDSSMMNGLQAVQAWENYFGSPQGSRLGIYNGIYSLGALMAVPFVPWVSDQLGRRMSITAASVVMIIGATLQGTSQNYDMFLAGRWLLGFGVPLAIVNASSLLGELGYAKERHILTSIFNASWYFGAIVAAATTYGTFSMASSWAWRIPSLLQILPSIAQISFMYWCPESPRWLMSKDRGDESYAILAKYHSEGIDGDEFVRLEFAQIQSVLALEAERARKFAWADVWRDAAMRRRFLIATMIGFFTQFSGNNLLSFYLKLILNMIGYKDNRVVQKFILANTCWGLISAVPIALIAPRYPRRKCFLICTIGLCTVYIAWTVASARREITDSHAAAVTVIAFIFLYSPFYNIGWNALTYTYMVEIFPFNQRAKGIAVEQLSVRVASFFNTYINPIALDKIKWKYYIVYCIWICVEIITIYYLFPETHNRSLEELSFMFEGSEAQLRMENKIDKALRLESPDIEMPMWDPDPRMGKDDVWETTTSISLGREARER